MATYDEDDSAEIACDFKMTLGHFLAEGNDYGASLTSYNLSSVLSGDLYSVRAAFT